MAIVGATLLKFIKSGERDKLDFPICVAWFIATLIVIAGGW